LHTASTRNDKPCHCCLRFCQEDEPTESDDDMIFKPRSRFVFLRSEFHSGGCRVKIGRTRFLPLACRRCRGREVFIVASVALILTMRVRAACIPTIPIHRAAVLNDQTSHPTTHLDRIFLISTTLATSSHTSLYLDTSIAYEIEYEITDQE
jgi:hypothetical protein